ncbi:alpha-L-fucosidase [Coraliomargarita akajimensis]|uniref:alpha-L-fucosidase n=1 Tax=Coraliomargarita akajimensis (strain DSM 45221 / IAM 15411 / JCM 23193 / KCTC 12865 / 04OKA010-24) TaxID=583355 RepID=D5ER03_CORAD|nr:alpha-L-fucosidase [Coraliomargarita akajimensis]ADE53996.1 Alpha-L-fucosidase [Coraliomargarita akajimensis DSM 45221]
MSTTQTTHELDGLQEQYAQIRAEMQQQPITAGEGPFEGTPESLQQFECPEWFRDAKFGIWAHWGPQGVTRSGDWYARNLYIQDYEEEEGGYHKSVYGYHCERFGHPSKVGYKDTLHLWKAEDFDPDALIKLYKDSGARYFMALGVHTDNFDCWDSKFQRWNSVNIGPKRDIVGAWRDATRKHGLHFAVSEHTSNYYHWFGTSMGADKTGPLAGVPYDGCDERYRDLYNSKLATDRPDNWLTPPDYPKEWAKEWYFRMKDLLDKYEPDLFYSDGAFAVDEYSHSIVAYLYNESIRKNGGKQEAVFTQKNHPGLGTFIPGAGVFDIERGLTEGITEEPWQIDTCLGNWFYEDNFDYKSAQSVIHFLIDVVSKNGNMMLSVPLRPEGTVDDKCQAILAEIKDFLDINGESIYATRPWKTFGEGGVTEYESKCHNEKPIEAQAGELRFTRSKSGDTVYAFILSWPESGSLTVQSFADEAPVQSVELLGAGAVTFTQGAEGLTVQLPASAPGANANVLKIRV